MIRVFSLLSLCAMCATAAAAASGPGGLIAFSSTTGVGGKTQIWVMHANGGSRHAVGHATANRDAPALSADGKRIAFAARGDVYVMNVDGSHVRRLTSGAGMEGAPAWSRDGRWIAYSSYRAGRSAIWKMRADGSHKVRLTHGTIADVPDWAPDGRIAFAGDVGDIWVMNADGRALHRLTKTTNGVDWAPSWSRDGRRIAYESDRAPVSVINPTNDIWVMNADGSHQVRLTRNAVGDGQPTWSPDDRWIIFTSSRTRDHTAHLWLMRPNGSALHRATSWPGEQYYPSWSR